MNNDHWFDTLHKLATHGSPRRGVLSAVVALTSAQRLGATDTIAKNGGKNKKKGKKGKNNKPKPKPKSKSDPSCEAVCSQEFTLHPEEIPACVQKCNDCRIRDNFCVIEGDSSAPT